MSFELCRSPFFLFLFEKRAMELTPVVDSRVETNDDFFPYDGLRKERRANERWREGRRREGQLDFVQLVGQL